jgi:hypothetical protein
VIGDAFGVAAGLSYHGLILESLGEVDRAIDKFTSANDSFEKLGARAYASDALAGIVRCLLGKKELEAARKINEQLWNYIVANGSDGMEFPAFAYQTCAEAFTVFNEPSKAQKCIENGYTELMERAAKISDPAWRNSFLENVPENKALTEMWTRLADDVH